jgi:hypothetical protein
MILSIGYEALKPARLLAIAERFDATVIDVRGSRHCRTSGYGSKQLPALLGKRYEWRGEELGNKDGNTTTKRGLENLVGTFDHPDHNAILLCREHAAGDCHRHFMIAKPLLGWGVDVLHICGDELVYASDLQHMLDGKATDYPCGTLDV